MTTFIILSTNIDIISKWPILYK